MAWTDPPEGGNALREAERETTQRLFNKYVKIASRNFARDGEVEIRLIAEINDALEVIPPFGANKQDWVAAVRAYLEVTKATRYVLLFEAFFVDTREAPDFDPNSGMRPSEHPGRREGVYINAGDRFGNYFHGSREIIRDAHGFGELAELRIIDDTTQTSGLMVRLLKPRSDAQSS